VYKNFPVSKEKDFILLANMIKLKEISINWYPSVALKGQATYQSDVVEFGIDLPLTSISLPEMPKDQYKAYFDIDQVIYDGGSNKSLKEIENSNVNIKLQQTELELFKIKEQINSVFFSILILKQKKKLLVLKQRELNERISNVKSAVNNGILLPLNLDILKAEFIRTEQKIFEIKNNKVVINKNNLLKCHLCNACLDICKREGIKIEEKDNEFVFYVESFGQLSCREIVLTALEEFEKNLKKFVDGIKKVK